MRIYTLLIDIGLLAGLALAYWRWRRRGHAHVIFLDAVICALIGAVIGGRAFYVATNGAYFATHRAEILALWKGGMAFHGAFLGGLLALALYALLARRPFWDLGDAAALGLALGGIFGWAACFAAGYAYGIVGEGALFLVSPDIYGIEASRLAVQPLGIALSVVTLAVLLFLIKTKARPGLLLAVYLLIYFGGQFILEFGRGDESVYVGPLRLAQALDVLLALAGLGLMLFLRRRPLAEPASPAIAEADAGKPA